MSEIIQVIGLFLFTFQTFVITPKIIYKQRVSGLFFLLQAIGLTMFVAARWIF
jgi:hypothetical protein